jgi:hypothetical protein
VNLDITKCLVPSFSFVIAGFRYIQEILLEKLGTSKKEHRYIQVHCVCIVARKFFVLPSLNINRLLPTKLNGLVQILPRPYAISNLLILIVH